MRTGFFSFLTLAFLLLMSTFGSASVPTSEKNWDLDLKEDGIRVYTRSINDSRINAFRAETVLDAPLEAVLAVMSDPRSCMEWVHQCVEAYNLPNGSFNDRYAYSINDMPWPASDRDYVLHIRTMTGSSQDEIIMKMDAVPDRREKRDGYVRMEVASTVYELTREGENRTRMIWYQHAEPGGSLPAWLVNRLATDIPYESLKELNRVVQEDQYQGYTIEYDNSGQIQNVVPPESMDEATAAEKARRSNGVESADREG
jgi:hypothetical protein